jgi:hypothetical protein
MTRITPLLTSRKVLTFTYPNVQETQITPETLPTSEPTDPQISYTVGQSDLVQLSFNVFQRIEVAILNASGQFITAGTLNYRMVKNGSSVKTGSFAVSANYYYRLGCYFYNVAVGDVLGIKLWSSVADSNWDMKTFWMDVTRITPLNKPRCLYNVEVAAAVQRFSGAGGGTLNYYLHDNFYYAISTAFTIPLWYPAATYGMFRVSRGDNIYPNSIESGTGATRPDRKGLNYVPSQIIFRGLRID